MHAFPPARQNGLFLHGVLIVVLASALVISISQIFNEKVGPSFTFFVLLAFSSFAPLPFLGYRAYALWKANYMLDREILRIIWGLRIEDIPLSDIEWIRPAHDLLIPLANPIMSMPGAVLGTRKHPDMGDVEFIAADSKNLLLVATARKVIAISPADPAGFVRNFQHAIEMGALAQGEAYSQYPSFVISEAWKNPFTRYAWLAGLLANISLLVWVTLIIPTMQNTALGFTASLEPLVVEASQLLLLPVLSILLFITGWLAGLYFYRWEEYQPLAVILWGSGALSSLSFLAAVYFLITTPL